MMMRIKIKTLDLIPNKVENCRTQAYLLEKPWQRPWNGIYYFAVCEERREGY